MAYYCGEQNHLGLSVGQQLYNVAAQDSETSSDSIESPSENSPIEKKINNVFEDIKYSPDFRISLSQQALDLRLKPQEVVLQKLAKQQAIVLDKGDGDEFIPQMKWEISKFAQFPCSVFSKDIGIHGASCGIQGGRATMEDIHGHFDIDIRNKNFSGKASCFYVLDGHGGSLCATYMNKKFPEKLINKLFNSQEEPHEASIRNGIIDVIAQLQYSWLQDAAKELESVSKYDDETKEYRSGTTLCATLVIPRIDGSKEVWTASVGDSRALMIRKSDNKTIQLSRDASLDDPKFCETVKKWGGNISCRWDPDVDAYVKRVGKHGLARALGGFDIERKNSSLGISPFPTLHREIVAKGESVTCVIQSDGLSGAFGSQAVADLIEMHKQEKLSEQNLSVPAFLVGAAQQVGSDDNITCMVVEF